MEQIQKYPRTPHLAGSGLQPGDHDVRVAAFVEISGRALVVEEKMDGANCAISFGSDQTLRLQSRGHYLTGGPRERQFDLLKRWTAAHSSGLWKVLGDRHVMYGEWCYALHTIFYDQLPHYFLEFDILDRTNGTFLDTPSRRALLHGSPVASAPVMASAAFASMNELIALVGLSSAISHHAPARLESAARELGLDISRTLRQADVSGQMEGLYIKVEEDGIVQARYKFVRGSFHQTVLDSGSHWQDRPLIANQLAPGTDIFAGAS